MKLKRLSFQLYYSYYNYTLKPLITGASHNTGQLLISGASLLWKKETYSLFFNDDTSKKQSISLLN